MNFQLVQNHNLQHLIHLLPYLILGQVSSAISIHKAQGLEYDSVKIVITDEIGELITHNIFYTAITRAKNNLKIYWTPETEKLVLSSLKIRNNQREIGLLTSLYFL